MLLFDDDVFVQSSVGELRHMKGRAITTEEFERMLDRTAAVVGKEAAPSWQYVLKGLWHSALRIDELMRVSWDIDSKIGEKAGIIVAPGDPSTGRPAKYASAHDQRRSCAERMLDAGVPPMTIARVLRHASWETTRRHYVAGDVQKDAGILRELMGETGPHEGEAGRRQRTQRTSPAYPK